MKTISIRALKILNEELGRMVHTAKETGVIRGRTWDMNNHEDFILLIRHDGAYVCPVYKNRISSLNPLILTEEGVALAPYSVGGIMRWKNESEFDYSDSEYEEIYLIV